MTPLKGKEHVACCLAQSYGALWGDGYDIGILGLLL
jgi:hypothetical protein